MTADDKRFAVWWTMYRGFTPEGMWEAGSDSHCDTAESAYHAGKQRGAEEERERIRALVEAMPRHATKDVFNVCGSGCFACAGDALLAAIGPAPSGGGER